MSISAEEALLRAKAIAARLTGNTDGTGGQLGMNAAMSTVTTTTTSTATPAMAQPAAVQAASADGSSSSSSKRKRWGVAPAIVEAAQEVLPGLAAKKQKDESASTSTRKKIWVRTNKERGAAHFKAYFATRLKVLEDEINEVESGASATDGANGTESSKKDKVTLELQGRGSSAKPLPGVPVEPLHILVSGSPAVVAAAEIKVDTVLTEAEQAPIEAVDPEEEFQAESQSVDNSMALTTVGNRYSSNSSYRPATVAQLISNNPIQNIINGGGDLIEETIQVPNGMVGFLIGRGGENITSMQARSNCKVQIQKEHDLVPGQTNREITLQATSQDSINQCRQMIESMIQDRMGASGAPSTFGGAKDAKVQDALSMGHALVTVDVPDADVGLIIGKGGMTIKSIQEQTGAQVQIPPSGSSEVRVISITAPIEEAANMAKSRIEDVLASKPSFSEDRRSRGPQISVQVMIPDKDVGLCIGRGGCVIKEMQQRTGTRIQIPSQPTPGQAHRIATVSGPQDGCNQVQGLIERIVNEQSSAGVMSPGGHMPQQQQQPYYQQQHAAATNPEWQAYYAAQQALVSTQQAQAAPAPAAAPAAAPGADAYYEQFFRYAYYYGEPAARQYYGAWSPAPGTPNPYGVNPNGITAPPVAAASPAPVAVSAPAAAPIQHSAAGQTQRESSVRKVSNLPAWMTQGK